MSYVSGGYWGICDRCSQKRRHGYNGLIKEWTGLMVCPTCLDPIPPEMIPPRIYPEGIAVPDPRPPQDADDYLQDETRLLGDIPAVGTPDNPGLLSPLYLVESPEEPLPPDEVASSQFFRTGPVGS